MWQGLGMTSPGLQRGQERILGGVLTGECRSLSQSTYRGDQAQTQKKRTGLFKKCRATLTGSIDTLVLWQGFGLLTRPGS